MRSLPGRWWSRGEIRAWPGRDPVIGLLTAPSRRAAPLGDRLTTTSEATPRTADRNYAPGRRRRNRLPGHARGRVVPRTSAATIVQRRDRPPHHRAVAGSQTRSARWGWLAGAISRRSGMATERPRRSRCERQRRPAVTPPAWRSRARAGARRAPACRRSCARRPTRCGSGRAGPGGPLLATVGVPRRRSIRHQPTPASRPRRSRRT
jgi:hypothetical protein